MVHCRRGYGFAPDGGLSFRQNHGIVASSIPNYVSDDDSGSEPLSAPTYNMFVIRPSIVASPTFPRGAGRDYLGNKVRPLWLGSGRMNLKHAWLTVQSTLADTRHRHTINFTPIEMHTSDGKYSAGAETCASNEHHFASLTSSIFDCHQLTQVAANATIDRASCTPYGTDALTSRLQSCELRSSFATWITNIQSASLLPPQAPEVSQIRASKTH